MKEYSNFAMKFLTQPRVMINSLREESKIYTEICNLILKDIRDLYECDSIYINKKAIQDDERFEVVKFENTDDSIDIKSILSLKYKDRFVMIKLNNTMNFITDMSSYEDMLHVINEEFVTIKKKKVIRPKNAETNNVFSSSLRDKTYEETITLDAEFIGETTDINILYSKLEYDDEFYSFIPECISTLENVEKDFWSLYDKQKYDNDKRVIIKYTNHNKFKDEGIVYFDDKPVLSFLFIGEKIDDSDKTHLYHDCEFANRTKIDALGYISMINYLQSLNLNEGEYYELIKNNREESVMYKILKMKKDFSFDYRKFSSYYELAHYMEKTGNDILDEFNSDPSNISKPFYDFFTEYIKKSAFIFKNRYFPSFNDLCFYLRISYYSRRELSKKDTLTDDDIVKCVKDTVIPRYNHKYVYSKLESIENPTIDSSFIFKNIEVPKQSIDEMCEYINDIHFIRYPYLHDLDSNSDEYKVPIARKMSNICEAFDIESENIENMMKGMVNNMTPCELLNRCEVKDTTKDFSVLIAPGYNHIPELISNVSDRRYDNFWDMYNQIQYEKDDFIEIRYFANKWFDSRRCWQLGTVMFKGIPVMIFQNAGREGDDFSRRFIISETKYLDMIEYMESLYVFNKHNIPESDIIMDIYYTEMPELTEFYGHKLETVYDDLC